MLMFKSKVVASLWIYCSQNVPSPRHTSKLGEVWSGCIKNWDVFIIEQGVNSIYFSSIEIYSKQELLAPLITI